jgi:hypothetical protein
MLRTPQDRLRGRCRPARYPATAALSGESEATLNLYDRLPADRPCMLANDANAYDRVFAPAGNPSETERQRFRLLTTRSDEAMAGLFALCSRQQLSHQLHRIMTPTLLP